MSSEHVHSTISYQYLLRLITSIDTTLGDNSQSGMDKLLLLSLCLSDLYYRLIVEDQNTHVHVDLRHLTRPLWAFL